MRGVAKMLVYKQKRHNGKSSIYIMIQTCMCEFTNNGNNGSKSSNNLVCYLPESFKILQYSKYDFGGFRKVWVNKEFPLYLYYKRHGLLHKVFLNVICISLCL